MAGEARLLVGSDPATDVHIEATGVKSRHAILIYHPKRGWAVEDIAGQGTTKVNNVAVGRKPLRDGDRISFGEFSGTWPNIVGLHQPIDENIGIKNGLRKKNHRLSVQSNHQRTVIIGRSENADIRLCGPGVEDRHARLIEKTDGWYIEDIANSGRTWINGQPKGFRRLETGDIVAIGSISLKWPFEALNNSEKYGRGENVVTARSLESSLKFNGVSIAHFAQAWSSRIAQLSNVNLELDSGSLNAVIGPSGVGKSTLIRALFGRALIVSGSITFEKFTVADTGRIPSNMISLVPQSNDLLKDLTVGDYLTYVSRVRNARSMRAKEHRAQVLTVLTSLGIDDKVNDLIGNLSGGQQKRVSIASELLTSPRILVLDEPSSGLDEGLDKQLLGLLKELAAKTGMIIVMVTHSVHNMELVDNVILIGGKSQSGPPPKSVATVAYAGPPSDLLKTMGCRDYTDLFDSYRIVPNRRIERIAWEQTNSEKTDNFLEHQPNLNLLVSRRLKQRYGRKSPVTKARLTLARTSGQRTRSLRTHITTYVKAGSHFLWPVCGSVVLLTLVGAGFGGQVDARENGNPTNPDILKLLQFLLTLIGFFSMRKPLVELTDGWTFLCKEKLWGLDPKRAILAQVLADIPWLITFPMGVVFATQVLEQTLFENPSIEGWRIIVLMLTTTLFAVTCYALGILLVVVRPRKEQALEAVIMTMVALTTSTGMLVDLDQATWSTWAAELSPARQMMTTSASLLNQNDLTGWSKDPAFGSTLSVVFTRLVGLLVEFLVVLKLSMALLPTTLSRIEKGA